MSNATDPLFTPSKRSSKIFMDLFAELRESPQASGEPLETTAATLPVSTAPDAETRSFAELVSERYTIERELGRGGMGIVLLGHDRKLDRNVAIKLLPRSSSRDPQSQRRFLREARTVARLSHPNIVAVLDADRAGPFIYYTMAYIDGETLADRIRSRGRLPLNEVVATLREVAWALAYSHASGVVHRDIKPENILLEHGAGRTLVSDFGIAYQIGNTRLTGDDQFVGTPLFMSPEQGSDIELDGRSDIYSLGVVGFWLLAGEYPFTAKAPLAILAEHASTPAPSLRAVAPHVPIAVAAVIDRCLEKRPEDRFPRCEDLANALEAALSVDASHRTDADPLSENEITTAVARASEARSSLCTATDQSAEAIIAASLAGRLDGRTAPGGLRRVMGSLCIRSSTPPPV